MLLETPSVVVVTSLVTIASVLDVVEAVDVVEGVVVLLVVVVGTVVVCLCQLCACMLNNCIGVCPFQIAVPMRLHSWESTLACLA